MLKTGDEADDHPAPPDQHPDGAGDDWECEGMLRLQ